MKLPQGDLEARQGSSYATRRRGSCDRVCASVHGCSLTAVNVVVNRKRVTALAVAVVLLLPAGAHAKKKKPVKVEPVTTVSMTVPEPPQGRKFDVTISGSVTVAKLDGAGVSQAVAQSCLTAQHFYVAVKQRDVGGGNEGFADLRAPGASDNPGNPTDPFDPQPVVLGADGRFMGPFVATVSDSSEPIDQQQWEVSAEVFNYIGPPFVEFRHKGRKYRCYKAKTHPLAGTVLDTWHLIDRGPGPY